VAPIKTEVSPLCEHFKQSDGQENWMIQLERKRPASAAYATVYGDADSCGSDISGIG